VVLDEVRGKIWRKKVRKEELDGVQQQLQVISVRLLAGEPVVNIYSDGDPGQGFSMVEPVLEDVYFHRVGAAALAAE
jgi:ABC-2 type transport system ATP-binding protein